jgi:16S rRNA (guanine966-N2)-methyltransferase
VLKIISGEYRSRILLTPEGEDRTRPMVARVKESVFAMLHGWFKGARVLDLFAGVGTVGLECASRGAAEVVMIERDREVFRYLEHNIKTLGCEERAIAVQADALGPTALARSPKPVDLVFMDPPYALMVEHARPLEPPLQHGEHGLLHARGHRTRAVLAFRREEDA